MRITTGIEVGDSDPITAGGEFGMRSGNQETEVTGVGFPHITEQARSGRGGFLAEVAVIGFYGTGNNALTAVQRLASYQVHGTRNAAGNHVRGLVFHHLYRAQ